MKLSLITALFLSFKLLAYEPITVIGLDKNGEEKEVELEPQTASKRLQESISYMSSESLKSLDSFKTEKSSNWSLDKIYLGAGLGFVLGIGDTLKFNVSPSFYLILKKKK